MVELDYHFSIPSNITKRAVTGHSMPPVKNTLASIHVKNWPWIKSSLYVSDFQKIQGQQNMAVIPQGWNWQNSYLGKPRVKINYKQNERSKETWDILAQCNV